MQEQRNYTLTRRILFPYSGEEPLSRKQGLRVIAVWALLFPLSMSLCTLLITLSVSFTLSKLILLLVLSFLSGVFIFGLLGVIVVSMSNRAARLRQAWKARQGSNTEWR